MTKTWDEAGRGESNATTKILPGGEESEGGGFIIIQFRK